MTIKFDYFAARATRVAAVAAATAVYEAETAAAREARDAAYAAAQEAYINAIIIENNNMEEN